MTALRKPWEVPESQLWTCPLVGPSVGWALGLDLLELFQWKVGTKGERTGFSEWALLQRNCLAPRKRWTVMSTKVAGFLWRV